MIISDYTPSIEIHQPATYVRIFGADEWPRIKNLTKYSIPDVWAHAYDMSWIKGTILEIYQMQDGIVIIVLEGR